VLTSEKRERKRKRERQRIKRGKVRIVMTYEYKICHKDTHVLIYTINDSLAVSTDIQS
jgi:hypothetical protein